MKIPSISRRAARALAGAVLISFVGYSHASAQGTVNVFYAASLTNLNENIVGPAFDQLGYTYQGKAAGSLAIVTQVKGKLTTPDVVEFADPAVNAQLMGSANGNYVSWYFTFARSELVVGFDPRSKYARAFKAVQHHKLPWYKALEQKGLRLGRTDPSLDPKGYRALFMARLAQKVYHLKHFAKRIYGSPTNPQQIFPEEVLVARMLTGQIDAGIFYLSEVRDLGIPYITLPGKVNFGVAKYAKLYGTQRYKTPSGQVVRGAPIQYTITVPSTVQNQQGALAFVKFVLGKRVRHVFAVHGLLSMKVAVGGDKAAVPVSLRRFEGK